MDEELQRLVHRVRKHMPGIAFPITAHKGMLCDDEGGRLLYVDDNGQAFMNFELAELAAYLVSRAMQSGEVMG